MISYYDSDNYANKNFMRTIELTPTNYKSHLPLDIMACSYAYAGAMGEGGCIRFLDREGTLYHLNYCGMNHFWPGWNRKTISFSVTGLES